MNVIFKDKSTRILNFQMGEEVLEGLSAYVENEHIVGSTITGLGAGSLVDVAYYHIDTKKYERTVIEENIEILSLTGNTGMHRENNTPIIHLHGVFGRKDLSTFGGHLFKLIISGAGEIHLSILKGAINRSYDEKTGLTLMCPH